MSPDPLTESKKRKISALGKKFIFEYTFALWTLSNYTNLPLTSGNREQKREEDVNKKKIEEWVVECVGTS